MRAFHWTLAKKDSVVCDNADRVAIHVAETCNQSCAIPFFKLVESRPIQNTSQYLVHVQLAFVIDWNDSIQLICRKKRFSWSNSVVLIFLEIVLHAKISDDWPAKLKRVVFALSQMVWHTRFLTV